MPPLVTADDLSALIADPAVRVRLLDVRWRLDIPEGRPAYLDGHLPGAVYVDLEHELARPGHPEEGRHPLPRPRELQHAARRWGIDDGDIVVAYDDNESVAAARAWWLLRHSGLDARVLDGGLRAWIAAGRLLDHGDVAPRAGNVRLVARSDDTIEIDDVARLPREGVLVDARAPKYYRGAPQFVDPASGHVPGAVNVPTMTYNTPDGHLRSPEEILDTLAPFGVAPGVPTAVYCSSGIAAAHSVLALETAGIDARLFAGSWSAWARSPGRPIGIGPTPAEEVFAG